LESGNLKKRKKGEDLALLWGEHLSISTEEEKKVFATRNGRGGKKREGGGECRRARMKLPKEEKKGRGRLERPQETRKKGGKKGAS